jgi:hypothetical protein
MSFLRLFAFGTFFCSLSPRLFFFFFFFFVRRARGAEESAANNNNYYYYDNNNRRTRQRNKARCCGAFLLFALSFLVCLWGAQNQKCKKKKRSLRSDFRKDRKERGSRPLKLSRSVKKGKKKISNLLRRDLSLSLEKKKRQKKTCFAPSLEKGFFLLLKNNGARKHT